MGVGSGGPWPPWVFIHDTDKVDGGFMVLFFGLVFSIAPFLENGNFSADTLDYNKILNCIHEQKEIIVTTVSAFITQLVT